MTLPATPGAGDAVPAVSSQQSGGSPFARGSNPGSWGSPGLPTSSRVGGEEDRDGNRSPEKRLLSGAASPLSPEAADVHEGGGPRGQRSGTEGSWERQPSKRKDGRGTSHFLRPDLQMGGLVRVSSAPQREFPRVR